MTTNERDIYENVKTASNKYFLPYVWASSLLKRARKEERITSDHAFVTLVQEVCKFRGSLATLFNYDWISIPLMYTQVVTIAVRVYFFSCLFGRQFLDTSQNYESYQLDIYIPVFTFLQFLFYVGWLKVAESLINPFGEDDDDYETNCVLDRIIQVGYLIVDELHNELPTLVRDQYWDEVEFVLPYTAAAKQYQNAPFQGSADQVQVSTSEQQLLLPVIEERDESAEMAAETAEGKTEPKKSPSHKSPDRNPATAKSKGLVSMLSRNTRAPADQSKPAVRLVSVAQFRQQRERDAASAKAVRIDKHRSDPIVAPANRDSLISITKKNMEMQGHTMAAVTDESQVPKRSTSGEGAQAEAVSSALHHAPPGSPIQVLVSSPDDVSGRNGISTSVTVIPTWSMSRGPAATATDVEAPLALNRRMSQAAEIETGMTSTGRLSRIAAHETPVELPEKLNSNSALNRQDGLGAQDASPKEHWHKLDV